MDPTGGKWLEHQKNETISHLIKVERAWPSILLRTTTFASWRILRGRIHRWIHWGACSLTVKKWWSWEMPDPSEIKMQSWLRVETDAVQKRYSCISSLYFWASILNLSRITRVAIFQDKGGLQDFYQMDVACSWTSWKACNFYDLLAFLVMDPEWCPHTYCAYRLRSCAVVQSTHTQLGSKACMHARCTAWINMAPSFV